MDSAVQLKTFQFGGSKAVQQGARTSGFEGFTSRDRVDGTRWLVCASGVALALVLGGCREQVVPTSTAPSKAGAGLGAGAGAGAADQATSADPGANGAAVAGVSPPSGGAAWSGSISLPEIATSSQAKRLLVALLARLGATGLGASDGGLLGDAAGSALPAGLAEAFHATPGGGLEARFGASAERASAKVISPEQSLAPVHIEDTATGIAEMLTPSLPKIESVLNDQESSAS
jgi:hypothetical protein